MTTITTKFIKAFNPKDTDHVMWLKRMIAVAESSGDPEKQKEVSQEINKNPMKITLSGMDSLDWPHIHFVLCTVYANAVLTGKAFIPSP